MPQHENINPDLSSEVHPKDLMGVQGPTMLTVAVLTFRRPRSLVRTLDSLRSLSPPAKPSTCELAAWWALDQILIIDNDSTPSAQAVVESLVNGDYPHQLRYVHEPVPGLAAARNRAIAETRGALLAFIDDDEVAEPGWPTGLVDTALLTGAALVGGPVRTRFSGQVPAWIREGGFFDRPEPPDRSPQSWLRTGNLAIDLTQTRPAGLRFDERFGLSGGEDIAFSRQARQAGLTLSWSAAAPVAEYVEPERTNLGWLFRREFNSTSNWVRVETELHPGPTRKLLILARSGARLVQGLVMTLAGLARANRVTIGRGALRTARGLGAVAGMACRVRSNYG